MSEQTTTITLSLEDYTKLVQFHSGRGVLQRFRLPLLPGDYTGDHRVVDRSMEITSNIEGHLRFQYYVNGLPEGFPVMVPFDHIFSLFPLLEKILKVAHW